MIADYEGDLKTLIRRPGRRFVPYPLHARYCSFPYQHDPYRCGQKGKSESRPDAGKKPDTTFCVFCQKNKDTELPYEEDLYPVGVFAKLIKVDQDAWHRPDEHHHPGSGQMSDETSRSKEPLHSN